MTAQVACFNGDSLNAFKFTFSATPCSTFRFDIPPTSTTGRPAKRRRPLWDVDGSTALGKKKRRLRLNLITSKLSKPFSSPASNVADHGVKKIAEFKSKEVVMERGDLRKTAITNCLLRRVEDMRVGTARARALLLPSPMFSPTKPSHSQNMCQVALRDVGAVKPRTPESSLSLPPSPLGQSNYDALDLEDEEELEAMYGSDVDHDEAGSSTSTYMGKNTPRSLVEGENYDFLDEMDGISHDVADSYEALDTRWWEC